MTVEELRKEYQDKINALKEEFNNKIAELQKAEQESNKRWKPEYNENYYFINGVGEVKYLLYRNDNTDNEYYNFHNMFKTKEEAEFMAERWKVIRELEMLADDDKVWDGENSHYTIDYAYGESVYERFWYDRMHPFYFKSKESTEKAIKIIGEDRLKKYWFGIKEK